ncbi:acyl carrier protein [Marinobacter mobilis]|uniref:Acyl carrier protein n=1 Tax=Marinobacter mobilis TaxID=488533 RepID=A0A1H2QZU2_9GAMM|nr:acyl carrier protein [Marinobacter mobilis]SDW12615.1 acyl carrier protein [Marinobacter mobilis]
MNDQQQRIVTLIAEQLAVPATTISSTSRLVEDLGADSLDLVELTMALEERFALELTDDQADQLVTVGDVLRFMDHTEPRSPA